MQYAAAVAGLAQAGAVNRAMPVNAMDQAPDAGAMSTSRLLIT